MVILPIVKTAVLCTPAIVSKMRQQCQTVASQKPCDPNVNIPRDISLNLIAMFPAKLKPRYLPFATSKFTVLQGRSVHVNRVSPANTLKNKK
jgi:hypothetical protein